MLVVHATKKLRDRVKAVLAQTSETSTTRLGDWYATASSGGHKSAYS